MPRLRAITAVLTSTVLLVALAACGSSDEPGEKGSAASAGRCEKNQDAGKITYMSGYYWQASASILEVIAADQLGYFNDLCLDVELQPGSGDVSQNAKLIAAGKVQVGPLSEQDIMTSNASGLDVLGVSSYSNAGLDVLMTGTDITDLKDLEGKTLGHKGWVPVGVQAMLAEAGVDMKKVKQVKVGYDPGVLPRGQVDALVGFVSNEPNQLEEAGEDVKVWEPTDFDVPGSLGAHSVNPAWAKKHPTAVQDFLRAVFKAYRYCAADEHVEECIDLQHDRAGAESDEKHETAIWRTEVEVGADNPLPGKFGSVDPDNVAALAGVVSTYAGQKVTPEQAASWFDTSYADAVVGEDGKVIWPAP
ncbi:NitT/TauT family transport system substrate-binding protein [Nocardioides albertanoniae]|uniref:NitT/TauT family transport system substrate-binding protein n=1 Tax=Nocardioides albertanoniae TaxID=1175486 RepID=A0A543ABA4_9ACTN|nr:ABC transporter substrate-binding protein [Nocardioides albertanoniae]TQL69800.1 NitT/TauT family transport system substrate-binding protein [Nocardioides albertanoniae]